MLAKTRTFCLDGVLGREVEVEVHVHSGLPAFTMVGLPDAGVRESRDRVRSALLNSGFDFPQQRITVNLAPADLRKAGAGFDLAVAAGLLIASGQVPEAAGSFAIAGELALEGSVRPVPGVLAMAEAAVREGTERLAVPAGNGGEAALVEGIEVIPLERLTQLADYLRGTWQPAPPEPIGLAAEDHDLPDLAELRGQPLLRRALEICAAGAHSLLIVGPAGAGKSHAASRLPSILPLLSRGEALEVARIASACGRLDPQLAARRPFRMPHHTISRAGLVGGGSPPRAGEVTLAHRGVLFLDELPEFSRDALESLRTPMERGTIAIARARARVELPCRFVLVGAANPCPCGHGPESERCTCPPWRVQQYATRLSGALADRIDIAIAVGQPDAEAMAAPPGEASAAVRERVALARLAQERRLGPGGSNAAIDSELLREACGLEPEAERRLAEAHDRLGLSGRGHDRVMRLARTIADLAGAEAVGRGHLDEALRLRKRDPAP